MIDNSASSSRAETSSSTSGRLPNGSSLVLLRQYAECARNNEPWTRYLVFSAYYTVSRRRRAERHRLTMSIRDPSLKKNHGWLTTSDSECTEMFEWPVSSTAEGGRAESLFKGSPSDSEPDKNLSTDWSEGDRRPSDICSSESQEQGGCNSTSEHVDGHTAPCDRCRAVIWSWCCCFLFSAGLLHSFGRQSRVP